MARYYSSTRFRPECPTCGNKIGQLEESFKRLQEQGKTPAEALESLDINRPCCRRSVLWPVVLPIGAFFLPYHEASMLSYLNLKTASVQPNLVVLSAKRAAKGEIFITSHTDKAGFIGTISSGLLSEATEVKISDTDCLNQTCSIRVQTEPGEIFRGFPFETRMFNRGAQVDRVKSYFDLPLEQQVEIAEQTMPDQGPTMEDLLAAQSDDE